MKDVLIVFIIPFRSCSSGAGSTGASVCVGGGRESAICDVGGVVSVVAVEGKRGTGGRVRDGVGVADIVGPPFSDGVESCADGFEDLLSTFGEGGNGLRT